MLQRMCFENLAQRQIEEMRLACGLPKAKDPLPSREMRAPSPVRKNAEPQTRKHDDVTPLNVRLGGIHLQGVSSDGRIWVINKRRLTLSRMAHIYPALLAQLLIAARPALLNATEFYFAVVYARPSLARHADLHPYRLMRHAGRPDLQIKPVYSWVLDELNAPHPLKPGNLGAPARALNNKARFVR